MYINFAQPFELPPYWLNHPEVVQSIDNDNQPSAAEAISVPHACPLKIKWASEQSWWQFPIEPVVTVSGKNVLIKRNVLKSSYSDVMRRGSVIEQWMQDDYEVTISGLFIGSGGKLPEDDLRTLRKYCEGREAIEVFSPLLTIFKITRLAIEEYQLPFTKGLENQMFTIKATTDDWKDSLLIR